jgi:hypothetical protein
MHGAIFIEWIFHTLDGSTSVDFNLQGRGGSMAIIVTPNGDIGSGYSIQPALCFHDAEVPVACQWSVHSLHVNHHEFFHRPSPTGGHFWQVSLPPLPPHQQVGHAPAAGSPYLVDQPPPKK